MPVTHVVATPVAARPRHDDHRGIQLEPAGQRTANLAAQLARTTGEKIIAAAIVERALPAGVDPIEDEYQRYVADQAHAVAGAGGRPDAA